jgi:DeoR/GlpR family transcriptional regulator of sugar metabolism
MNDNAQKKRRDEFLRLLSQKGSLKVQELADLFGVTSMTIRRDLAHLEESGFLLRTHGGCVIQSPMAPELSFSEKDALCAPQKEAIAREAVLHLEPGSTIFIDTGTTMVHLARALPPGLGLRVFTNNLRVATELFGRTDLEVFVYGGQLSVRSPDLVGEIALSNAEGFRLDMALLGADAIDTHSGGLYAANIAAATLDAAVVRQASRVMILADSGKLDRTSSVRVLVIDERVTLITDNGAALDAVSRLRQRGARVMTMASSER